LLSLFLPHMDCDSSMVSWFAVIGGSPAFILYFKFEESRALQAHRFRFDAVLSFFCMFSLSFLWFVLYLLSNSGATLC
jgi:uncharacterized RDD family membrane protein YckC